MGKQNLLPARPAVAKPSSTNPIGNRLLRPTCFPNCPEITAPVRAPIPMDVSNNPHPLRRLPVRFQR